MTITVIKDKPEEYKLLPNQLKKGKAYMDEEGDVYIGTEYGDVYAVSVCGEYVVSDCSSMLFREINLEIRVK